jgi:hypothetical protein
VLCKKFAKQSGERSPPTGKLLTIKVYDAEPGWTRYDLKVEIERMFGSRWKMDNSFVTTTWNHSQKDKNTAR